MASLLIASVSLRQSLKLIRVLKKVVNSEVFQFHLDDATKLLSFPFRRQNSHQIRLAFLNQRMFKCARLLYHKFCLIWLCLLCFLKVINYFPVCLLLIQNIRMKDATAQSIWLKCCRCVVKLVASMKTALGYYQVNLHLQGQLM